MSNGCITLALRPVDAYMQIMSFGLLAFLNIPASFLFLLIGVPVLCFMMGCAINIYRTVKSRRSLGYRWFEGVVWSLLLVGSGYWLGSKIVTAFR